MEGSDGPGGGGPGGVSTASSTTASSTTAACPCTAPPTSGGFLLPKLLLKVLMEVFERIAKLLD